MADNTSIVTISGVTLSLLLYENVRSEGDQMGFLLGETYTYVTKSLTDGEHQLESVKTHIDIQNVLRCSISDLVFDSCCKINHEKLKNVVKDKSKIIGWYIFRKNSSLTPTIRDKLMHKQFANIFSKNDNFITCMMTVASTKTQGTHKFRHVFFNYTFGEYNPVPLRINNLGDDATKRDGSDYKVAPTNPSQPGLDVFTQFVKSLNIDLDHTPGVVSAVKIQKASEQRLESLVKKVCESDVEVAELEKKVFSLKESIFKAKMENIQTKTNPVLLDDFVVQPPKQEFSKETRKSIRPDMASPKITTGETDVSLKNSSVISEINVPVKSANTPQRRSYSKAIMKKENMEC